MPPTFHIARFRFDCLIVSCVFFLHRFNLNVRPSGSLLAPACYLMILSGPQKQIWLPASTDRSFFWKWWKFRDQTIKQKIFYGKHKGLPCGRVDFSFFHTVIKSPACPKIACIISPYLNFSQCAIKHASVLILLLFCMMMMMMMRMTMMTNIIPYWRTRTHIWEKVLMGIWASAINIAIVIISYNSKVISSGSLKLIFLNLIVKTRFLYRELSQHRPYQLLARI